MVPSCDRPRTDYNDIWAQVDERLPVSEEEMPPEGLPLSYNLPSLVCVACPDRVKPTMQALIKDKRLQIRNPPLREDGSQPPQQILMHPSRPGCPRGVYCLLLSMHLRLLKRLTPPPQEPQAQPQQAPQPWSRDEILTPPPLQLPAAMADIEMHVEVCIFAHTLYASLFPPTQPAPAQDVPDPHGEPMGKDEKGRPKDDLFPPVHTA